MSLVNGCWFRATTGGTGSFEVASAITGYMTPAQADAEDGGTYGYRAESDDNSQWEIGEGVYTASGTLLSRSVLKSSNSNAAVPFSAAPRVMLTPLASDFGGGGGAWEVIEDEAITAPVEYVDIALPTGYRAFKLELIDFVFDTDFLLSVLSDDNGSTFIGGDYNGPSDEYQYRYFNEAAGVAWADAPDTFLYPTSGGNNIGSKFRATFDIWPDPQAMLFWSDVRIAPSTFESQYSFTSGTVLASHTRINVIRIFPDGNYDHPPTSGDEITAGRYRLLGWPE